MWLGELCLQLCIHGAEAIVVVHLTDNRRQQRWCGGGGGGTRGTECSEALEDWLMTWLLIGCVVSRKEGNPDDL